jgi:hypothetical protein
MKEDTKNFYIEGFLPPETEELIKNEMERSFNSTKIEDIIKEREEDLRLIDESFKAIDTDIKTVNKSRKEITYSLCIAIIYISVLKILKSIINDFELVEELDKLINKISSAYNEIISQKEVMIVVRDAYKKLKSLEIYECNGDISDLLVLMYEKNRIIHSEVINEVRMTTSRIKGFNTSKVENKELLEINSKIDKSLKRLGLIKE